MEIQMHAYCLLFHSISHIISEKMSLHTGALGNAVFAQFTSKGWAAPCCTGFVLPSGVVAPQNEKGENRKIIIQLLHILCFSTSCISLLLFFWLYNFSLFATSISICFDFLLNFFLLPCIHYGFLLADLYNFDLLNLFFVF